MQQFNPHKSSRSINNLIMPVKKMALDHVHACKLAGIELLAYCTYRSPADQNALYAQGRKRPGTKEYYEFTPEAKKLCFGTTIIHTYKNLGIRAR